MERSCGAVCMHHDLEGAEKAREPAYIEPLLLIYSLRKYELPGPAGHWESALNITEKASVLVELNSSGGCGKGT